MDGWVDENCPNKSNHHNYIRECAVGLLYFNNLSLFLDMVALQRLKKNTKLVICFDSKVEMYFILYSYLN